MIATNLVILEKHKLAITMIALVIGATGATGKELVRELIEESLYTEVHLFIRSKTNYDNLKIKSHLIDFDSPESWKNLVSGDVAFSCLGTTRKSAGSKEAQTRIDVDYQYNFAKSAKENKVEDFILVSAAGANPNSPFFYAKMKGELENKIKTLGFEKLTIFQPGMLERPNTHRFGEVVGNKILKLFTTIGILKQYRPLPTKVLAKAMVNASKKKRMVCQSSSFPQFSILQKNVIELLISLPQNLKLKKPNL